MNGKMENDSFERSEKETKENEKEEWEKKEIVCQSIETSERNKANAKERITM